MSMMSPIVRIMAALVAALLVSGGIALAQGPTQQLQGAAVPCGLGMVEAPALPRGPIPASYLPASVLPTAAAGQLRVTFVGHATFLLKTPEGASLATDYNGRNLPRTTPDIVTMNNFHITHYTDFPDPGIKYVLRGWDPNGGIARHDMKLKDLRVYSVPTNIQTYAGNLTNGNSIFVFDTVNLCLAHLSHLHHDLSQEEVSRLGRIDVLFVPIDGYVTMSHDEVMSVIDMIKPRIVIVMHWDLFGGPRAFLARAAERYSVKVQDTNVVTLSRDILPTDTEIWLMRQGP